MPIATAAILQLVRFVLARAGRAEVQLLPVRKVLERLAGLLVLAI